MKILIADDHSVVRAGLRQILSDLKIISLIEEAKDGKEALQRILTESFDFVILDISMPLLSGLDVLKALKARNKKVNVLILSIHPQGQFAIRALRLGASGYLSKDSASEELALAIKKISEGGRYISSDIIGKLVSNFDKQKDLQMHERLSEREFQIMCFLAKGTPITDIAKELFISEKTITTYRARLLEKMEMRSNSELALYAYKNGLIE